MAAPVAPAAPAPQRGIARAAIATRTLRKDRWWLQPVITFTVLGSFIIYATWAAFSNSDYWFRPYISPFYSPCLASIC
ncbi:MAG: hypothetical protein ACRDOD_14940, partial [Streptosporangiaceae bacterium]